MTLRGLAAGMKQGGGSVLARMLMTSACSATLPPCRDAARAHSASRRGRTVLTTSACSATRPPCRDAAQARAIAAGMKQGCSIGVGWRGVCLPSAVLCFAVPFGPVLPRPGWEAASTLLRALYESALLPCSNSASWPSQSRCRASAVTRSLDSCVGSGALSGSISKCQS